MRYSERSLQSAREYRSLTMLLPAVLYDKKCSRCLGLSAGSWSWLAAPTGPAAKQKKYRKRPPKSLLCPKHRYNAAHRQVPEGTGRFDHGLRMRKAFASTTCQLLRPVLPQLAPRRFPAGWRSAMTLAVEKVHAEPGL